MEGPQRDAARWQLIAEGQAAQLCMVSRSREIPLDDYVQELEMAIAALAQKMGDELADFRADSEAGRKALAAHTEAWPTEQRRLYFRACGHGDKAEVIRAFIREGCHSRATFREVVKCLNGPLLRD